MRKALGYVALAVFVLAIAAGIGGYFYLRTLEPRLKNRAVQALSDRFDADVELKTLRFSLFPQPRVKGDELTIRHKQWNDPHPLIRIRQLRRGARFSAPSSIAETRCAWCASKGWRSTFLRAAAPPWRTAWRRTRKYRQRRAGARHHPPSFSYREDRGRWSAARNRTQDARAKTLCSSTSKS